MLTNSDKPMMGRFANAGFAFLSSTCGLPVEGSIGAFNQTICPQIASPQRLIATFASPACVRQTPTGMSMAYAVDDPPRAANRAATESVTDRDMTRIPLVVSFCLARSLFPTSERQAKKVGKETGLRFGQNDFLTRPKKPPSEGGQINSEEFSRMSSIGVLSGGSGVGLSSKVYSAFDFSPIAGSGQTSLTSTAFVFPLCSPVS